MNPNNILRGDPNCRYCDGTGVRYVPNGPDDFEKEVCECTDTPTHSVDDLLTHLGNITGFKHIIK